MRGELFIYVITNPLWPFELGSWITVGVCVRACVCVVGGYFSGWNGHMCAHGGTLVSLFFFSSQCALIPLDWIICAQSRMLHAEVEHAMRDTTWSSQTRPAREARIIYIFLKNIFKEAGLFMVKLAWTHAWLFASRCRAGARRVLVFY